VLQLAFGRAEPLLANAAGHLDAASSTGEMTFPEHAGDDGAM
jgi:hypothetical protein